jgi:hypothetical protein
VIIVTTRELGPIPPEAAARVLGVPAGELLVIIRKEDGPCEPQAAFKAAVDDSAAPGVKAISLPVIAPDRESDAHPRRDVYTPSAMPATAEEIDAARAALQRRHDTLTTSAHTLGLKEGTYGRPWWRCGSERLP